MLEKLGKPVVLVVTDNFAHDAKSSAEDNGMPTLRIVTVPADQYYKRRVSQEEVRPVAVNALNPIIDALTRPLTKAEANPKPKEINAASSIKIMAETHELALWKFNAMYLDNHWADGLPLLPPTPDRVKWMLKGTSRSPREVIGTVAPKNGVATIEKIAINAVMAGAKPEYLPVIIAAMEGLTDKDYDLLHVMASTGSFSLAIIVTGPIAKEIKMNSGIGFLGYGWQANASIGRAVRLSLINTGHLWPAENDMALVGRASSYTFQTFAENEENNPWKPYHVSLGFKPEDSCVTVSTVDSGFSGLLPAPVFGGGAVRPWTTDGIMDRIIKFISTNREGMTTWRRGTAIPSPMKYVLMFHPEFALELNRRNFDREKLQKYFYERTFVPYEELSPKEVESVKRRVDAGEVPADRVALFKEGLKPGGKIPLLNKPEDIHIIVAGGIPGYTFGMHYFAEGPYKPISHLTKLIRGATLTQAGR